MAGGYQSQRDRADLPAYLPDRIHAHTLILFLALVIAWDAHCPAGNACTPERALRIPHYNLSAILLRPVAPRECGAIGRRKAIRSISGPENARAETNRLDLLGHYFAFMKLRSAFVKLRYNLWNSLWVLHA